jgi:hypothetical protein
MLYGLIVCIVLEKLTASKRGICGVILGFSGVMFKPDTCATLRLRSAAVGTLAALSRRASVGMARQVPGDSAA